MRLIQWLAVALHGPADVLVTSAAFGLERNVRVLELGLEWWLVLKLLLVVGLTATWWYYGETPNGALTGLFLFVLGVVLVLPNVLVLAAV